MPDTKRYDGLWGAIRKRARALKNREVRDLLTDDEWLKTATELANLVLALDAEVNV